MLTIGNASASINQIIMSDQAVEDPEQPVGDGK